MYRYTYRIDQTDRYAAPYSKAHAANMGPAWVLSAPDGLHVGPMNLAIREPYCLVTSKVGTSDIGHMDVLT